jgi:hypothetical protein
MLKGGPSLKHQDLDGDGGMEKNTNKINNNNNTHARTKNNKNWGTTRYLP